MLSIILPRAQKPEECWLQLASDHLGVSRPDLQNYLAHGDNIYLANCTHILQNIASVHFIHWCGDTTTLPKALELVSNFNIQNTLPTLQHDFCLKWNRFANMGRIIATDLIIS